MALRKDLRAADRWSDVRDVIGGARILYSKIHDEIRATQQVSGGVSDVLGDPVAGTTWRSGRSWRGRQMEGIVELADL